MEKQGNQERTKVVLRSKQKRRLQVRGSSESLFHGMNISATQKSRSVTPAEAGHNQIPTVLLLGAPAVALCRAHASSPRHCSPFGSWGSTRDAKEKMGGGRKGVYREQRNQRRVSTSHTPMKLLPFEQ